MLNKDTTKKLVFPPLFSKILLDFIYLLYFWLHWVFIAEHGFSIIAEIRDYSSLGCMGFSLQRLLLLHSTDSRHTGFRSCGARALLLGGIWDLSGAGVKPVSLELPSVVIFTGPGGKSPRTFLYFHVFLSLACWVFMCLVYAAWWQDGNV